MYTDVAQRGDAVWRQLHNKRHVGLLEQHLVEKYGRQGGKQYTDNINAEQNQPLSVRKESGYKEDIYRQAGAARHKRNAEHRQDAVLAVVERSGRHDGRDTAAEAHKHGYERFAMQSNLVHHLIHNKCRPGHVARILHK